MTIETPWLTRTEAAAYLRITVRRLNQLTADGKVTRHKLGGIGHGRYLASELDALMTPENTKTA